MTEPVSTSAALKGAASIVGHEPALDFLLELIDTPAPSGYEGPAAEVMQRYARDFSSVSIDVIGNCVATANQLAPASDARRPRVSVVGHLDEIGFVVTKVDSGGLLRFQAVGGWDGAVPVGQRVRVFSEAGARPGTVGRLATHQLDDVTKIPKLHELWIDIGARDVEDARSIVRPGDPIVLEGTPYVYDNGRVMSRSLDNRIGTFIACEVARRSVGVDVEVCAVGTVSEETSLLGAETSAFSLAADASIVVDVIPASDVPGGGEEYDAVVGGGPVISFGAAAGFRIGRQLIEIARARGLDFQLAAEGTYTYTDADAVASAGAGTPIGIIEIPTRYLHTPAELLDLADVRGAIDLITAWVETYAAPKGLCSFTTP